ncbi:hypothetical protein GF354_05855, partial [Candidatus Peregrinibacteria bacterium]|nr:hypothetical protein [Candidatus Peregrinibacteria bacterium]
STFWKWKKRFDELGVIGLENRSKRPKRIRKPETPPNIIEQIQKLRRLYPGYGKEKINILLDGNISSSTIGRIIKRYNMFYRAKKKPRGMDGAGGRNNASKT